MEPYWDLVKRIILESDIVLEVLDARLVELSRNEEVENLIKEIGRPVIYVVNKSDLVNKERLDSQIIAFGGDKEIVFVSNKNKSSYKILLSKITNVFSKYGKRPDFQEDYPEAKSKHRIAEADIVVGVLGYPNVGKSSIINGLAHKKKIKVSKKPGTTHGINWIRISDKIKLIDSPGVIPLKREDEIRYGLIGARDSERLKNPEIVSNAIIKLFLRKNRNLFEKFYGIKLNEDEIKNEDSYSIINKIADKKRFLLKGGVLDENRASQLIIKDWQDGRLRL